MPNAEKNSNDQKILNLQKEVDKKRELLSKTKRFSPVTNCCLQMDGEKININTLDVDGCRLLAVRINALRLSAADLGLSNNVKISGYNLEQWIEDLTAKLANLQRKEEESKLKKMEDKLKSLLSDDTKIELELSEIEKELLK